MKKTGRCLVSEALMNSVSNKPVDYKLNDHLLSLDPIVMFAVNHIEYMGEAALRLVAGAPMPKSWRGKSARLLSIAADLPEAKVFTFEYTSNSKTWMLQSAFALRADKVDMLLKLKKE